MFNREESDIFKLEIDPQAKRSFLEMARWTKFLAVLGFVFLSLMLTMGIFFAVFLRTFAENYGGMQAQAIANMGAAGPIAVVAIFLIVIGVYFYPTYALFKYSQCIKVALNTDNKEQFNLAIKYLKNMFKYMGILMIAFLVLYGFQIAAGALSAAGK
jgi:Family of unknown function (DUF5362)